jgi:hypothetical protein
LKGFRIRGLVLITLNPNLGRTMGRVFLNHQTPPGGGTGGGGGGGGPGAVRPLPTQSLANRNPHPPVVERLALHGCFGLGQQRGLPQGQPGGRSASSGRLSRPGAACGR